AAAVEATHFQALHPIAAPQGDVGDIGVEVDANVIRRFDEIIAESVELGAVHFAGKCGEDARRREEVAVDVERGPRRIGIIVPVAGEARDLHQIAGAIVIGVHLRACDGPAGAVEPITAYEIGRIERAAFAAPDIAGAAVPAGAGLDEIRVDIAVGVSRRAHRAGAGIERLNLHIALAAAALENGDGLAGAGPLFGD